MKRDCTILCLYRVIISYTVMSSLMVSYRIIVYRLLELTTDHIVIFYLELTPQNIQILQQVT